MEIIKDQYFEGERPLYARRDGLRLVNCRFDPDANLAFEYSSVQATIQGAIPSVKNPTSGFIMADSIGQVILDENIKKPANCALQF